MVMRHLIDTIHATCPVEVVDEQAAGQLEYLMIQPPESIPHIWDTGEYHLIENITEFWY